LSKQQVVIQAYYDSISIVPSMAPGAENACSIAALFQVIKAFKAQPPKRSVTFLATAGHFEALAGTKNFIRQRIRGARSDPSVRTMFTLVNEARSKLEETANRVWGERSREEELSEDQQIEEQIRGLGGIGKAVGFAEKRIRKLEKVIRRAKSIRDPNRGKLAERKLTEKELQDRLHLIELMAERTKAMKEGVSAAREVLARRRQLSKGASLADKKVLVADAKRAVERLVDALDFSELDISLWFSIDLSSHNDTFGIFYKGYFYDYDESIQWKFSDVGKKAREYGDLIARELSVEREQRLVDGINAIQGKSWQVYMAGKLGLSNEVAVLAGIPGFGFATIDDTRPWIDTPMDVPAHVEVQNLVEQTRFLACLLCDLVSIEKPADLYDIELDDNFVEAKARVVEFDPRVSTFPDEPVPGAIAVARTGMKTAMGIRSEVFDLTTPFDPGYLKREMERRKHPPKTRDEKIAMEVDRRREKERAGRVNLMGLPNTRAKPGLPVPVEAYVLDPETGEVVMAPDQGVSGAEAYPINVTLDQEIKPVTVVVFRCKPMAIYDMVDQRFFELLSEMYVYDAARDAAPYEYGYCLPVPAQELVSAYEPVAVVFAPSGMKVKVTMGASVLGLRFVLVNPTEADPLGEGYLIDSHPSLYATPYRVAVDMWKLDDGPQRLQALLKHGISNDRVMRAHSRAKEELDAAAEALRLQQYDKFFSAARAAWSFESQAYPQIRSTLNDVIKGILFYLALLLPFSFFTERLLIASPYLKWQIVGNVGIFVAIFIIIGLVHPAFAITFTPVIILLAFIILALTVVVVGIIVQKFEEQMKEVRYEQTGIHTADVGRLGATAAAFNLGISNMRRRKTRTLLTCLTLILLTFTVLSFTSVVQTVRRNWIPLPKIAPYNGIMIRDKTWAPIGEPTTRIMDNEFGGLGFPVAARAWYFSSKVGEQSFVTVSRGALSYSATAMVGLTPQEEQITRPQRYLLGDKSRWFKPGDDEHFAGPGGECDG